MITAVIVDDELLCHKALLKLTNLIDEVEIVGQAFGVKEGVTLIKKHQPDILFLDIEMPDGTGFNLLEQFTNPSFQVIFTTGHNAFAIKAFKHSAIDYLLKPVEKESLLNAVSRAIKQIKQTATNQKIELMLKSLENDNFSKLAIPAVDGVEFIEKKDILYAEADGSYSVIFLRNGDKIITTHNLKKISDLLGEKDFFRVHKSYVIALVAINKLLNSDGGGVVLSNEKIIPIARRRKDEFLKLLGL